MTLITNPLDEKQRTLKAKERLNEIVDYPRDFREKPPRGEPYKLDPGVPVFLNPTPKQQKHEEVKKIAIDMAISTIKYDESRGVWAGLSPQDAWRNATKLYDFIKKQEEGDE